MDPQELPDNAGSGPQVSSVAAASRLALPPEAVRSVERTRSGGMFGWKIAFCAAAAGASLGFVIAGTHLASWILICLEVTELIGSGIAESMEKE